MKVVIQYTDKEEETFEGVEVLAGHGYFQIQKPIEQKGPLVAVEETTDSVYIPFSSIRHMRTCNSED